MARYANTDKLKTDILMKYKKHWEVPCSSEDRLIQSIVTDLRVLIEKNTTADVAPRAEVFEEVDKFRADLMNKFIDLCRGNDYNKLTLLKIGDVVDEMYDRRIAELKNKYAEGLK